MGAAKFLKNLEILRVQIKQIFKLADKSVLVIDRMSIAAPPPFFFFSNFLLFENQETSAGVSSLMVSAMRFLSKSTERTRTLTISPTLSTSEGCFMYLLQI